MNQPLLPARFGEPSPWDEALYAFLAEKGRRSGSRRTVEGYARMLWPFFQRLGKTPDRVAPGDVLAWAHGIGLSGRVPSSTTVGARIACLSSFYRFLRRMMLVASNPCDALERPRSVTAPARGLTAADVRGLLAVVPDTRPVSTSVSRGGKTGRRELPRPAYDAIVATLSDCGKFAATMVPDESLWQACAGPAGITSGTFYGRFRRYLRDAGLSPTGLHILRHTAAKLRREAGESIEAVSAFLDHSSLAVTTVYLRRLEGVEDRAWADVAAAIGV